MILSSKQIVVFAIIILTVFTWILLGILFSQGNVYERSKTYEIMGKYSVGNQTYFDLLDDRGTPGARDDLIFTIEVNCTIYNKHVVGGTFDEDYLREITRY